MLQRADAPARKPSRAVLMAFEAEHQEAHSRINVQVSIQTLRNHLQLFRGCCTHAHNTHKASLQQSCWTLPVKHQAGAHSYPQVYVQEPYWFQWEPTCFLKRISINNFSIYTVEKLKLLKPQSWRWWVQGGYSVEVSQKRARKQQCSALSLCKNWAGSTPGMVTGMEKFLFK